MHRVDSFVCIDDLILARQCMRFEKDHLLAYELFAFGEFVSMPSILNILEFMGLHR